MVDSGEIVAVLAVAKTGDSVVDIEAVLAVAKTGDMAVRIAVRGWEGDILAVAVVTAKTGGGDVDLTTQGDKIVDILAVAVITAKIDKLLAKNIAKKKIIKIKISKIICFSLI